MNAPTPPPAPASPPPARGRPIDRMALWQIDAGGLALCAALAAAWYYAGLQPLQQARADRVSAEEELRAKTRDAETLQADRAGVQHRLKELEDAIGASRVRLEPADRINERVAGLTALARDEGLRLDEIKPGAGTALARYMTVPIHISGSGLYAKCAGFLTELHGQFPDVGVTSLDLRGEPATPDRPPHFVFDLVWYAAPEAARPRKE